MTDEDHEGEEGWRKLIQSFKALPPSPYIRKEKPKRVFQPKPLEMTPLFGMVPTKGGDKIVAAPLPLVTERRLLRSLHRSVGAPFTVDLHNHYQHEAALVLRKELRRALQNQHPWGLIITGKGRSGEEGVLRRHWKSWVEEDEELRPFIRGYAPAGPAHGGSGAFYIVLRRLA